jgi:hypothetical protein
VRALAGRDGFPVDPIIRGRLVGLWPRHGRSRDRFRRWCPEHRRVLCGAAVHRADGRWRALGRGWDRQPRHVDRHEEVVLAAAADDRIGGLDALAASQRRVSSIELARSLRERSGYRRAHDAAARVVAPFIARPCGRSAPTQAPRAAGDVPMRRRDADHTACASQPAASASPDRPARAIAFVCSPTSERTSPIRGRVRQCGQQRRPPMATSRSSASVP